MSINLDHVLHCAKIVKAGNEPTRHASSARFDRIRGQSRPSLWNRINYQKNNFHPELSTVVVVVPIEFTRKIEFSHRVPTSEWKRKTIVYRRRCGNSLLFAALCLSFMPLHGLPLTFLCSPFPILAEINAGSGTEKCSCDEHAKSVLHRWSRLGKVVVAS